MAVRSIGAQGACLFSTNINMLKHWVTAKIGLNGLDWDLDQNKHRINLEWVTTKIGLKFKPRLFRLYLDRI